MWRLSRRLTGTCTDEVEVPEIDRRCNDLPARARLASLGNAGRDRTELYKKDQPQL